jgi:hypothetical protein
MSSRASKRWTAFAPCVPAPGIDGELWLNNRYQVLKRLAGEGDAGPVWHLSIKRVDKKPIHDWRDLQRIKNELVGPEAEAVELYPAESRLVDTANQYHLWAFPGVRFPFGFEERLVGSESSGGAVQRPFEEAPADAKTGAELEELVRGFGR